MKSSQSLNLSRWFILKILKRTNISTKSLKIHHCPLQCPTLAKCLQWMELLPHSNLDVSQPSVWRLHAVCEEDDLLVLVCDRSKCDWWEDDWERWRWRWRLKWRWRLDIMQAKWKSPRIHHQGPKSVTRGKVQCDIEGRSKWFQHPVTIHRSPSRWQLRDLQHS